MQIIPLNSIFEMPAALLDFMVGKKSIHYNMGQLRRFVCNGYVERLQITKFRD